MDELERVQSTITFDVQDAFGADIAGVHVTMDGGPLPDKLGGIPQRINPGEHTFTFEAEGRRSVSRTLVVKEGQKGRIERVVLPDIAPVTVQPVINSPRTPSSEDESGARRERLGLVVGGVGIAGLAVGAVFGLLTISAWNAQKRDCESTTNCPDRAKGASDHDAAVTNGTVATIACIGGGVLLASGIVLVLSAPRTATKLSITPGMTSNGGVASVHGTF
jgi:hypothetical protein